MKVGFIGLGIMGSRFATNLLKKEFPGGRLDLIVHDLSAQAASEHLAAGATWGSSPRELAEQCDVILTSLPGPAEVESVCLDEPDGLLAAMAPGKVLFDLSTNSPTRVRELHAEFEKKGVHFLDAPVSGGPAGAASGKLAIWVGGDKKVFDAWRGPLDVLGDQVRYIGDIGAGSVAKLVHNASGYAIQTALAEIFSVGVKAGVEPVALWEAVRQGAHGRARTFEKLGEHFLVNKYDPPNFALKLAFKDVSLAAELGRDMGVPMRSLSLTHADMTEALGRGWADRDSRSPMLLQLERAGIEISADPQAVKKVVESDKQ